MIKACIPSDFILVLLDYELAGIKFLFFRIFYFSYSLMALSDSKTTSLNLWRLVVSANVLKPRPQTAALEPSASSVSPACAFIHLCYRTRLSLS